MKAELPELELIKRDLEREVVQRGAANVVAIEPIAGERMPLMVDERKKLRMPFGATRC